MVLRRTLDAFADVRGIGLILTVIHPDDAALYQSAAAGFSGPLLPPVHGAATRQGSILAGLQALEPHRPERVLIHDAARPFVSAALTGRVLSALDHHRAVLPALPVADTVKRVCDGQVLETVPREGLWLAQTPQGFSFPDIVKAHKAAAQSGLMHFTDDASIAEWAGLATAVVEGDPDNVKLTGRQDFTRAEIQLRGQSVHHNNRGDL